MENNLQTIVVTVAAATLAWMASTLIEVDKRTAVIEVRVEENYKMLEPMWQDWLLTKREASVEQNINAETDYEAAAEKEEKTGETEAAIEVVLVDKGV
jgi:hypothetical protein